MTESSYTESYFERLLAAYFPLGGLQLRRGASGMNNTTRFVEAGEGEAYVLRIYETHRDTDKAAYEHQVLLALAGMGLPFRTPLPVRTLGGATMVRWEPNAEGGQAADPADAGDGTAGAGKIAALFRFIEGDNPVFDSPAMLRSFGRTAGQLSVALAGVHIDAKPVYRPYYELDQVHPDCTLADVAAFCADPPQAFRGQRGELLVVGRRLETMRKQLDGLSRLPHQLVHGDLNASNCLAGPASDEVTAVLDFEFVTRDIRVMEPSVCLSELIDPSRPADLMWPHIDAFLSGFGEAAALTADEIEAIPALIMLRRLDVFIHFLGRYRTGLDSTAIVADQIVSAYATACWLDECAGRLVDRCRLYLGGA